MTFFQLTIRKTPHQGSIDTFAHIIYICNMGLSKFSGEAFNIIHSVSIGYDYNPEATINIRGLYTG